MNAPATTTPLDFLPDPSGLNRADGQRYAEDDKLYVQFHSMPVMNEAASRAAERPVYVDVTFVRIMVPGDKHSIIDRRATPEDKRRFRDQLQKFEEGRTEEEQGTPLKIVPWLTPAQVEEYKYFNVHTVEQLAGMADSAGQKFLQFNDHKRRANEFLSGQVPKNVQKELDSRDEKIASLEAKLEELMSEYEDEAEG